MKSPPRAPKQRSLVQTKARILAAAQQAFSEQGYAQVGIREIAATAGISSPMLLRYFGSKAGLFEAALVEAMRVGDLFEERRDRFGEHLIHLFVDPSVTIRAPSILALSAGHPDAREIATRVTAERVIEPLAKWLGPPDARARALEIVMLALSFVHCTRMYPLIPAHTKVAGSLAQWFSHTLQAIVDKS